MYKNVIYIQSLTNLRNYRYYSALYCRSFQYLATSSVESYPLLCKTVNNNNNNNNYHYYDCFCSQQWRYQHQETGIKGIKYKNDEKQIDKPIEKIPVPEFLSMKEKLKKAVKEYGSIVIIFHVGISLTSLGICYLLVSSGLDVPSILASVGLEKGIIKSDIAKNAGTFALAYAIHKVFAPVRIAITLGSVPFIVRYLRKIGFLNK